MRYLITAVLALALAWCITSWLRPSIAAEEAPATQPAAEAAAARNADDNRAAVRSGPTDEDYRKHIVALKAKAPEGFVIVESRPFVVIGDESRKAVERHARYTVAWSVGLLKKDYFTRDPDEIIDIWLFKDDASYRKYTRQIFNDSPSTPFGYYSTRHKALIMNISTGGGTLVHEIVHPLVRANFPDCPAWFNEGLGSLYEQCEETPGPGRGGHIRGRTNWRLAGLQRAIRDKKLLSFESLTGTDDDEFYGEDSGRNYAQARYLCYYLQEKGLLVKFYQQFAADVEEDPTGYKTLVKVLGENDMAAFQKRWEAWVLKLRFP
ncbi:MAG: hypothetical protein WD042_09815 [Phycisphaeraceae bacterium]